MQTFCLHRYNECYNNVNVFYAILSARRSVRLSDHLLKKRKKKGKVIDW